MVETFALIIAIVDQFVGAGIRPNDICDKSLY